MYQFIKYQYLLGRLTAKQVLAKAPKYITKAQAEEIINSMC